MEELFGKLLKKVRLEFEAFKEEMLSLEKEEIFEKYHIIATYSHMLEIIENERIKMAEEYVIKKLLTFDNTLKEICDYWFAEDGYGAVDDEDHFITATLAEVMKG